MKLRLKDLRDPQRGEASRLWDNLNAGFPRSPPNVNHRSVKFRLEDNAPLRNGYLSSEPAQARRIARIAPANAECRYSGEEHGVAPKPRRETRARSGGRTVPPEWVSLDDYENASSS